ncbi:MAG TPA: SAM-dependent methyltransferase [Bacteroidales bacterium]|nr:SAM-dependent methyltransferase [Bacteroidales bacterium]
MFSQDYWNIQYNTKQTGWNIGYASPPVVLYFEKIENKNLEILIPGAGLGFEVEALYNMGFTNLYYSDFAPEASNAFENRCPEFPKDQILTGDFFALNKSFDFIVEQTFFSSLPPDLRDEYARKMRSLLKPGGKLVGLFFNRNFQPGKPPYGGSETEYVLLFSQYFNAVKFIPELNSIKPRLGTELWAEISNTD